MKLAPAIALGALLLPVNSTFAQDPVTLFDGTSLDGWTTAGDANWTLADGAVQADSGNGFLVTEKSYADFVLTLEFWVDDPANSGVFIRCDNVEEIGADTCYEVNIFDQREDQTYRTGSIVNVAPPLVKIDAGGKWNRFEIRAEGSKLLVTLNGTVTVEIADNKHAHGPITLQYGSGIVKFRNVVIQPL